MTRSRFVRALFWLACMAGTVYLLISLFLPSSRRIIFGVDKHSGAVRVVGNHVTFLPPHRYYRLTFEKREGAAQRDGVVRIVSKEGVPVVMTYRLRFSVSRERLADARTLVAQGWSAWIRTRVAEAVSAVTKQVPIEELLSPTSQFSRTRDQLRRVVAAHLARSGLNVTAFEIARLEPERDALLKYKRAELRRSARGVAGRVAIFGIDGADWDLISELVIDERMPNLKALIKGGASGALQTIQPTVSPLVWTTLATGVTPDRHGVIDFFDPNTRAPIDSYSRRAPAVWDIAEAFGRHATVVNFWAAWPPAPGPTAVFDSPVQLLHGAAYPPPLAQRVRSAEIDASTIGYDQVRRFLNVSTNEFERALTSNDPSDPVIIFRNVLAKTWTDHRVAIEMYRQQGPLVFAMTYEGTDVVNHLFSPYHPPYREGVNQDGYRKYWPAVANYYAEVDRLLGDWLQVLTADTTVFIVSAHGFRWEKNRPYAQPRGRAALSDHRNPGVFIAYGNHVVPSRAGTPVSLYDVVPSVLAILGLPKSAEMPGQVARWAFKDVVPVDSVRVVSYNEFFGDRPVATPARVNASFYQRQLQAVGHVLDPSRGMQPQFDDEEGTQTAQKQKPLKPEQWGSYAYFNNSGIELRKQGKVNEALESFQNAINVYPDRPTPWLNMAMTLFDKQQYTAADDVFLEAIKRGLPNGDQWFCDFAALYRQQNMTSRAITLLMRGREIYPESYVIAANLGSALAQADRYTEGLPELERALGLQPSSTLALNNLGVFYARQKDYARALDFWNRSLAIDARQPQIRAAAEAARSRL